MLVYCVCACVCWLVMQPYELELQPPALLIPSPIPLATDVRRRVKVWMYIYTPFICPQYTAIPLYMCSWSATVSALCTTAGESCRQRKESPSHPPLGLLVSCVGNNYVRTYLLLHPLFVISTYVVCICIILTLLCVCVCVCVCVCSGWGRWLW